MYWPIALLTWSRDANAILNTPQWLELNSSYWEHIGSTYGLPNLDRAVFAANRASFDHNSLPIAWSAGRRNRFDSAKAAGDLGSSLYRPRLLGMCYMPRLSHWGAFRGTLCCR